MRNVTYYDPTTGEIIATIRGPEADIAANAPPGSAVLEGHYDPERHIVRDGRAVVCEPKTRKISYRQARAEAYPPLGDLADAIYWQSKGDQQPLLTWIAAVDAVKTKILKTEVK